MMAATRAGPETIGAMHRLCDKMDSFLTRGKAPETAEVADLNGKLHDLVAEASGNHVLRDTINRLVQVPAHRTFESYSLDELRRSFHQHRQLTLAIEAGDFMAAAVTMKAHILDGRRAWSSQTEEASPSTNAFGWPIVSGTS